MAAASYFGVAKNEYTLRCISPTLRRGSPLRTPFGSQIRTSDCRPGAKPLTSHLDQNFLLHCGDARYVLKVANAAVNPASVDLQQRAMLHLEAAADGARYQQPVRTTDGALTATVEGHQVWMATYVDGRMLSDVCPQTGKLLRGLGRFLGRLDRSLMSFEHPYVRREYFWDLRRAGALRQYMPHVVGGAQRRLVERMLCRYEAHSLPWLSDLRCSPVHNDANDANIVVDGLGYDARVAGIIDFGDLLHAPTVFEVAIAATYAMLGKPDPVGVAAEVVRGYHGEIPLLPREVAVLLDLICARLCCSVLVSAYRATVEPDNVYVRVSEAPAWELLKQLSSMSRALAHYRFREACGMEPCLASPRIVSWMREHRAAFAPVIKPDVRQEPPLVFDFSVESTLTPRPGEDLDPHVSASKIFDAMQHAGAAIGLGRYDEARLVYCTEQFLSAHGERRSIHLGVDLFREAGAPVFAPMECGCGGERQLQQSYGLRRCPGAASRGRSRYLLHLVWAPEPGLQG